MMVDKVPSEIHNMATINALCLESLPEFLEKIVWFKNASKVYCPTINYTLNILRFPSFQSPLVLPEDIRTERKEDLERWLDRNRESELLHQMEINQTQRRIAYLDVVTTPHREAFEQAKLKHAFKHFLAQYDQRIGKSFMDTFPKQLTDWYMTL